MVFCCLYTAIAVGQTLKGVVYDENDEPIFGAEVYLNGTSIKTITDDRGMYELVAPYKINTPLVISFIGYTSRLVLKPFENDFMTIFMTPKPIELQEVNIVSEGLFTRAEKLKVFREQFLGTTTAGKSCSILNEDDVRFFYNKRNCRLSAFSDVPIVIYNAFLGYEVAFRIGEFHIDFNSKSIDSDDVISWHITGTTFYKDLTTPEKSYYAQRKMSYEGSQMQFFRNLVRHKLGKENFQLMRYNRPCDPDDYFTISQNFGYYNITFLDWVLNTGASFWQSFKLEYREQKESVVTFTKPSFRIDVYGNNDSYEEITFTGEIAKKRAGDLLPLDFNEK